MNKPPFPDPSLPSCFFRAKESTAGGEAPQKRKEKNWRRNDAHLEPPSVCLSPHLHPAVEAEFLRAPRPAMFVEKGIVKIVVPAADNRFAGLVLLLDVDDLHI